MGGCGWWRGGPTTSRKSQDRTYGWAQTALRPSAPRLGAPGSAALPERISLHVEESRRNGGARGPAGMPRGMPQRSMLPRSAGARSRAGCARRSGRDAVSLRAEAALPSVSRASPERLPSVQGSLAPSSACAECAGQRSRGCSRPGRGGRCRGPLWVLALLVSGRAERGPAPGPAGCVCSGFFPRESGPGAWTRLAPPSALALDPEFASSSRWRRRTRPAARRSPGLASEAGGMWTTGSVPLPMGSRVAPRPHRGRRLSPLRSTGASRASLSAASLGGWPLGHNASPPPAPHVCWRLRARPGNEILKDIISSHARVEPILWRRKRRSQDFFSRARRIKGWGAEVKPREAGPKVGPLMREGTCRESCGAAR